MTCKKVSFDNTQNDLRRYDIIQTPFDEPDCLVKCFFNSPQTLCPALFITSLIPMNYTSLSELLLWLPEINSQGRETETNHQKNTV